MDNAKLHGQVRPEIPVQQDKTKERAFFGGHAEESDYNGFSDRANDKILKRFLSLAEIPSGARVADLGRGSGLFAHLLSRRGFRCTGVDLSPRLIEVGRRKYPELDLREGDVEALPFSDGTFDAVLLSGIVHHLPEPARCAAEVRLIPGEALAGGTLRRCGNGWPNSAREWCAPSWRCTRCCIK